MTSVSFSSTIFSLLDVAEDASLFARHGCESLGQDRPSSEAAKRGGQAEICTPKRPPFHLLEKSIWKEGKLKRRKAVVF